MFGMFLVVMLVLKTSRKIRKIMLWLNGNIFMCQVGKESIVLVNVVST